MENLEKVYGKIVELIKRESLHRFQLNCVISIPILKDKFVRTIRRIDGSKEVE